MYTREEASQIRQAFWTALGQYLSPIPSADGIKVNWLNYKTGVKHVYFRMQADKKSSYISIDITHTDPDIQELYFEQFKELRVVFEDTLKEEWQWELHVTDENYKMVSRIYKEFSPVNIFNQNDWPKLISFFKPRILALDEFWSMAKYSFEALK
jgi:hypothetical protein